MDKITWISLGAIFVLGVLLIMWIIDFARKYAPKPKIEKGWFIKK